MHDIGLKMNDGKTKNDMKENKQNDGKTMNDMKDVLYCPVEERTLDARTPERLCIIYLNIRRREESMLR